MRCCKTKVKVKKIGKRMHLWGNAAVIDNILFATLLVVISIWNSSWIISAISFFTNLIISFSLLSSRMSQKFIMKTCKRNCNLLIQGIQEIHIQRNEFIGPTNPCSFTLEQSLHKLLLVLIVSNNRYCI